jgi:hypothetical protein
LTAIVKQPKCAAPSYHGDDPSYNERGEAGIDF